MMFNENKPATPYEQVAVINTIAGNIPEANWDNLRRQFKIFFSEVVELARAFDEKDINGMRDAIADITVTNCGFPFFLNCDGGQDFLHVANSLLTRFDSSYEDAVLTAIKYKDRGVKTTFRETVYDGVSYWATVVAEESTDNVTGETLPVGKFLKSHKYRLPVFDPIAENTISRLTNDSEERESIIAIAHRLLDEKRN